MHLMTIAAAVAVFGRNFVRLWLHAARERVRRYLPGVVPGLGCPAPCGGETSGINSA
jgi:hypothetical protein